MHGKLENLVILLYAALLLCTSCDDILDKTSKTALMNSKAYWSNLNEVSSFTSGFYNNFLGYGQDGYYGWSYYQSLSDDQVAPGQFNWQFYAVPSRSGYWDDAFAAIRRANAVINNMRTSSLPQDIRTAYTAISRLNRAWLYFQLVREYGDVPWITEGTSKDDDKTIVAADRTDRDIVVDSIVRDLDYAVAHLKEQTDRTSWSSDLALAIESDVCLYEGTYCKYRTRADNGKAPDKERAIAYLRKCHEASAALIISGKYQLTKDYGDIYHSLDLSHCKEIIFYRNYDREVMTHNLITATCNSPEVNGITKDAFDSFLFLDGRPKATTTLDKSDSAVVNADGDYSISHLLAVRDRRLSVITDSIIYFKGKTWSRPCQGGVTCKMASSTGYGIRKFDDPTLDFAYRTVANSNYTDAPLFWYAVILLNDAEALTELGIVTQDDLDATVNLLEHRAGLPGLTLKPLRDPANSVGVSRLLWEIRRARRCELMLDNWYRYWDLVRWHELDRLDSKQHPDVNLGAKVSGTGAYIVPTKETRIYKPRYYFFPIPSAVLKLNRNMRQNPGWE